MFLRRSIQILEDALLPRVREVMSSPVETVPSETDVMKVIEAMVKKEIGSVVVVDDGEPMGIFTRRDMVNRVIKMNLNPLLTKVSEVMSKPLIMGMPTETITAATTRMNKLGITRLVISQNGQLMGIVTMTDIRLRFSRGYSSHHLLAKKFVVDTFAYITFWSALVFVNQVLIVGIEMQKFIASSIIGFILTILLGGPYGRYLDILRQKFHV